MWWKLKSWLKVLLEKSWLFDEIMIIPFCLPLQGSYMVKIKEILNAKTINVFATEKRQSSIGFKLWGSFYLTYVALWRVFCHKIRHYDVVTELMKIKIWCDSAPGKSWLFNEIVDNSFLPTSTRILHVHRNIKPSTARWQCKTKQPQAAIQREHVSEVLLPHVWCKHCDAKRHN